MENFNAWAQFGELETTEPLIPLQIEQIQQKRHFKIASKWRKSEFYDSLEIENSNGNRVWYQDYSTIDWIHDLLKDKNRARVIQSSSLFVKWFDASQAWILVFFTGLFVLFFNLDRCYFFRCRSIF